MTKSPVTIRLTEKGQHFLKVLSSRRAMPLSVYVEQLLLDEAQRLNLPDPGKEEEKP